jgi:NAD(P)-dependent dehydrogenase (short-subunit alcohol dehydrogenase family)
VQLDNTLRCDRDHRTASGALDETARRLSHSEHAVAQQLAAEGHHVHALGETPGQGRQADLLVCGRAVEVKSWMPLGAGRVRPPTARSVINKLLQAQGQADVVVLNARRSGLAPGAAKDGMAGYAARSGPSGVATVRVMGDGFDLTWSRDRSVSRARQAAAPRRRADPDLGMAV